MKKTFYLLIVSSLVCMGLHSCDGFLDTPAPEMTDQSFFANDKNALSALAGAYDPIGWNEYIQYLDWAIGDVTSDDAVKGGGGDSDQPQMYDIEHFRATAETPTLGITWKQLYIGINRANRLIKGVTDNPHITPALQKRLIAEAKFLRGYNEFVLIKVFGAFPIVDHLLEISEYQKPRNTMEECWKAIENDMKAAMEGLPKRTELAESELGRATWGSAAAFLTKAYIFQEKWKEAYDMATTLIDSKEYDLLPNYGDIFTIEHDNSIEGVFEIQRLAINTPLYADQAEASVTFVYQWSRDTRHGGWGFDQPTQNLYDEFEPNDPRRGWTIISDGDVLWPGTADEETVYTKYDPVYFTDAVTGYVKRKGALPKSQRLLSGRDDQTGMNVRVIRFADVLLWQAEAAVHTGKDWQTPLNRVRARVGLGASPYVAEPLKAVYHERRVELALESHRYWDLVRTKRGNLMEGYKDNKRYLPIPQGEISLNPSLTPNPY